MPTWLLKKNDHSLTKKKRKKKRKYNICIDKANSKEKKLKTNKKGMG